MSDTHLLFLLDCLIKEVAGKREEFNIGEKPFFQLLYEIQAGERITEQTEKEFNDHVEKIRATLRLLEKEFKKIKTFKN